MRVVVIGGRGHIGSFLVPRLVAAGHEVTVVSRGRREPYVPHAAWREVRQVILDRGVEEAGGQFGIRVRELRPDIVVDLICFTLPSAQQLVEALRGEVQQLLHCGTIWVHGPSVEPPTTETAATPALRRLRRTKGGHRSLPVGRNTAARTFQPRSFTPAISSGRAGRRSTLPGTSTHRYSRGLPPARSWRCRISAWKRCITSTPTTWRRCSCGPWRAGAQRLAKAFTPSRRLR